MTKIKVFIILLSLINYSCKINNNDLDIVMSEFGASISHNSGQDCMQCHVKGGEADLEFSIAGTVYRQNSDQTYPNTIVNLFGENAIEDLPVETFEVDLKGNFYSNIPIDWQIDYYVSVTSDYKIVMMNSQVINGSCNSCHGTSMTHIYIE